MLGLAGVIWGSGRVRGTFDGLEDAGHGRARAFDKVVRDAVVVLPTSVAEVQAEAARLRTQSPSEVQKGQHAAPEQTGRECVANHTLARAGACARQTSAHAPPPPRSLAWRPVPQPRQQTSSHGAMPVTCTKNRNGRKKNCNAHLPDAGTRTPDLPPHNSAPEPTAPPTINHSSKRQASPGWNEIISWPQ